MRRANPILPVGPLKSPKANKYGVSAPADRTFDGRTYASKAEMERARELIDQLTLRVIDWLVFQPEFQLGCGANVYRADFMYSKKNEFARTEIWVEDVKGAPTAKFRRDVKLWQKYGPFPLCVLTRKGDGWETEIVTPTEERETR